MGVCGLVLSVLTQFLSNRSQYVVVDGCRSKLTNLVSGVPQGRVLGPQLFLLFNCGALPVPHVPVWVTRGALIAHRDTYAPHSCRTSQYRRTFIPLSVSLWNALVDPVFDGVGLAGFKTRSNAFLLA